MFSDVAFLSKLATGAVPRAQDYLRDLFFKEKMLNCKEIRTIFIRLSQFIVLKLLSCIYRDGTNASSSLALVVVQYQSLMLAGPLDVSRIVLGDRPGSYKNSLTDKGHRMTPMSILVHYVVLYVFCASDCRAPSQGFQN